MRRSPVKDDCSDIVSIIHVVCSFENWLDSEKQMVGHGARYSVKREDKKRKTRYIDRTFVFRDQPKSQKSEKLVF